MNELYYYSHRYSDPDPSVQRWNLSESKRRFEEAREWCRYVLWAPWIILADNGVDESLVWPVIEAAIAASAGILLDLDGSEMSDGMRRERGIAERLGKDVVTIGLRRKDEAT